MEFIFGLLILSMVGLVVSLIGFSTMLTTGNFKPAIYFGVICAVCFLITIFIAPKCIMPKLLGEPIKVEDDFTIIEKTNNDMETSIIIQSDDGTRYSLSSSDSVVDVYMVGDEVHCSFTTYENTDIKDNCTIKLVNCAEDSNVGNH